jgi:hypothetical protein
MNKTGSGVSFNTWKPGTPNRYITTERPPVLQASYSKTATWWRLNELTYSRPYGDWILHHTVLWYHSKNIFILNNWIRDTGTCDVSWHRKHWWRERSIVNRADQFNRIYMLRSYSVGDRELNVCGALVEWYWQGETEVHHGLLWLPSCVAEKVGVNQKQSH